MDKIWKITNGKSVEYYRGAQESAIKQFEDKHGSDTKIIAAEDNRTIQAVFLSDYPNMPLYCFSKTQAAARKIAEQYIRQWELSGVKVERIETI